MESSEGYNGQKVPHSVRETYTPRECKSIDPCDFFVILWILLTGLVRKNSLRSVGNLLGYHYLVYTPGIVPFVALVLFGLEQLCAPLFASLNNASGYTIVLNVAFRLLFSLWARVFCLYGCVITSVLCLHYTFKDSRRRFATLVLQSSSHCMV